MPLLRITCPPGETDHIVDLLASRARASEIAVVPIASRSTGGDLILAEVPRSVVDDLLMGLSHLRAREGLHIAIEASEHLVPGAPDLATNDDDSVVWAEVVHTVHETGRLSWINTLLIVTAAAIAAIGIIEDQLLLIVGAMALSPDYFPIADICLSLIRRDAARMIVGLRNLAVMFGAGAVGAWLLTLLLQWFDVISPSTVPDRQLTLFISEPNTLSLVVAVLAGVAGALAITLSDARGLVGVFVSITTIPAAANIGVALAVGDPVEMRGAAVQLVVNVAALIVAGSITLEARRLLRRRSALP